MKRLNSISLLVVVILAVTVCLYLQNRATVKHDTAAKTVTANAKTAASKVSPEKVVRVLSSQVLATVNGKPITLRELMPITTSDEQEISQATYDFFLERAVDRELILQAAKARGVTLTESEEQHLAQFRGLREQPEPGLISKFTVNPAEIEFEMLDAEAFMLQTSLMAQAGATPNITPDQVSQYYQANIAEFGELPADPQERQEAWQKIDFEIRGRLASDVRNQYNWQLQVFMNNLKTAAQITMTPPS